MATALGHRNLDGSTKQPGQYMFGGPTDPLNNFLPDTAQVLQALNTSSVPTNRFDAEIADTRFMSSISSSYAKDKEALNMNLSSQNPQAYKDYQRMKYGVLDPNSEHSRSNS